MNQHKHFAQNWLQLPSIDSSSPTKLLSDDISKSKESVKRYALPNFTPHSPQQSNQSHDTSAEFQFNPVKHFVQGWNGDALNSKEVLALNRIIKELSQKALAQFLKTDHFTKSFKQELYNEFLSYAHATEAHFFELDSVTSFWKELADTESNCRLQLDQFLNIYINRVISLYMLKIRFISYLCTDEENQFSLKKALLNPNQLVNHLLRKGGTTNLHSKAFTSNLFSWWRTEETDWSLIAEMNLLLKKLNISQIIKIIATKAHEKAINQNQQFSHSISHKNFGLFLNSLLINFPTWITSLHNDEVINKTYGESSELKIISCKYIGDYLESLSHAHWLAQDNNKYFKWDDILCSDFKGLDFEHGTFFELFNELQFMTFLAEISSMHKMPMIQTITSTINQHFNNRKTIAHDQTNFLNELHAERASTYDRLVLNLCHFPKNNPNHFLISHIMEQLKSVKNNGFLYVLSDKKIFVPSLKDKVETLLKVARLETAIDLSEIKGKGEVPSYIYIFSKGISSDQVASDEKLTYSLRMSGDLDSFHFFHFFTDELNNFFQNNLYHSPAIYNKEFYANFRIEFYRDAIIKGRLIRSTDKETNNITHPAYFRKLCENSCPFDEFFEIEPIDEKKLKKESIDFALLNWSLPNYDFPYFAVLDRRNPSDIKLELFPNTTLKSIQKSYGFAYCDYFGLRPKMTGININIFREFLQSNIGRQLVQLNFQGHQNKFKSTLNSLLIPKFLLDLSILPDYAECGLSLLKMSSEEINEIAPSEFIAEFQKAEVFLSGLTRKFPTHILGLLVQFKNTLVNSLDKLSFNTNGEINFKNPQIYMPLMECPQHHVYPNNEEIFIQLKYSKKEQLEKTQHKVKLSLDPRDHSLAFLEAFVDQVCVVQIHLALSSAKFLCFLLNHYQDIPLPQLISALKIPKASDIDKVLTIMEQYQMATLQVKGHCERLIQSILINNITG